MIRSSTKLLCRLIDEHGSCHDEGNRPPEKKVLNESLPGVTGRAEWPDANLKAFYYGAELNGAYQAKNDIENGRAPHTTGVKGESPDDIMRMLRIGGRTLPNKVMLTGPRGVGKSMCLAQMVIHARRKGWLCIYVPDGWEHVWGGGYIQPITINDPEEVDPTEEEIEAKIEAKRQARLRGVEEEGDDYEQDPENMPSPDGTIYDNPMQTAAVLRGFWLAHARTLRDIPFQFPKEMEKYDKYLHKFADQYTRIKSLKGRERMTFMEVREIVDGDDFEEDMDDLDYSILESFKYVTTFRRECVRSISPLFLHPNPIIH
jgi:hypothetical protein